MQSSIWKKIKSVAAAAAAKSTTRNCCSNCAFHTLESVIYTDVAFTTESFYYEVTKANPSHLVTKSTGIELEVWMEVIKV